MSEALVQSQPEKYWDRAKPAHCGGAPYRNLFVAAYETMAAEAPYDGPEAAAFEAHRRAMVEDV